ncbi:unnamed protein product [Durusdinium trenchii]|uniref:5-formyltetrahydrofolate cyclo-ligase n=1 Tax=Durusdinium trenchii TaxID=1381693 RepID=A0ABP0SX35_9DINO
MTGTEKQAARKSALRQRVWDDLESHAAVLFPRPCHGRIPNCIGSAEACRQLLELPELQRAQVVKVHPSIGASALRSALVMAKKTVLVPPYPGADFLYLLLHHSLAPNEAALLRCGDKREYLKWARPVASLLDIPLVDVVVVATCVVAPNGVRLGKGKGYGEVEWGILTELGVVDSSVPVYTLCHDLQVVSAEDLKEEMMESHDLPVDAFATPSGLTRCQAKVPKPFGVRWDLVGPELEEDIGALRELRSLAPERLRAHRDACHATRAEAMRDPPCARPLWSPVTEQEWLMLTDAAVTHFAAEECKMRDGESKKLKWKGKGKGKSRGKKTDSANAQLSAQAESMSAQAEAEAAQQAALQAAQIIQQQQEQFSLPSTLQLRPFQGDLVDDEDSAEQRRLDAAEQQERASSAVKVRFSMAEHGTVRAAYLFKYFLLLLAETGVDEKMML